MLKFREGTTAKMEAQAGRMRLRRLRSMTFGAKLSLIVLLVIALAAVFAAQIAPHNPLEIFTARQAPSADFLFGTDDKGRDVLSRMIFGARYSLVIGLCSTALALVIGSIFGALAAVSSKVVNEIIMRIMDIIMSFPGIALAAVFVTVFGNFRLLWRLPFCISHRLPALLPPM